MLVNEDNRTVRAKYAIAHKKVVSKKMKIEINIFIVALAAYGESNQNLLFMAAKIGALGVIPSSSPHPILGRVWFFFLNYR